MSRSVFAYTAKARDCSAIRLRMREITQTRIHYGCERVLVMLRREGWRDNHSPRFVAKLEAILARYAHEQGQHRRHIRLSVVPITADGSAVLDNEATPRQAPLRACPCVPQAQLAMRRA